MTVWQGTGVVAGGLIVGAIITADMTRFNRSRGDVIKQTVLGVTGFLLAIGTYAMNPSPVLPKRARSRSPAIRSRRPSPFWS